MAVLTPADYKTIRRQIFQDEVTKAELKSTLATLPSESQLMSAFQVFEDDFTAMRNALRAKVALAFGVPVTSLTPKLTRRLLAHYLEWKLRAIFQE